MLPWNGNVVWGTAKGGFGFWVLSFGLKGAVVRGAVKFEMRISKFETRLNASPHFVNLTGQADSKL